MLTEDEHWKLAHHWGNILEGAMRKYAVFTLMYGRNDLRTVEALSSLKELDDAWTYIIY